MIRKLIDRLFPSTSPVIELSERTVALAAENAELRKERDHWRTLAMRDTLTNLPNQRSLNAELAEIADKVRCQHDLRLVTMLAVDLVDFKAVNDTVGHAEGDKVLKAVAQAIPAAVRKPDDHVHFVSRPSGDEFVIILYGVTLVQAREIARRIIEQIRAIPGGNVSARIGGAVWDTTTHPNVAPKDVLHLADMLEVALKQEGVKGQADVRTYTPN